MSESDIFVELINEKHSTNDIEEGNYFAEELKAISLSNIEQRLLKHIQEKSLFHRINILKEIKISASFGEYFNKVIKYGIKLGLKDHAICIALFTHSSLWEKQNTNLIPLIEWKEKDWKIYFEQLDSISTVPPMIKKDEVLQSPFQIAPSTPSTPSTTPQKNLSITLGATDQATPKSTLNQSSLLSLSNHSTPVKIITSQNFVNSQKITSESKQEFFEANDNVALKNLLTNAGKCVHLDFFNLDNKIGYCYGFIEDGTFQYRKMLGKSNSIELNFKLKGYLNLLQMVHMKGFNNTIITIYDVILFSALKDPDSIQSLTQPNRALFSSLASGKHIKTILIDQNCSYELVGNIRNAIKHFTVSNTKNYEISGVE